jgi:hypothetical protein
MISAFEGRGNTYKPVRTCLLQVGQAHVTYLNLLNLEICIIDNIPELHVPAKDLEKAAKDALAESERKNGNLTKSEEEEDEDIADIFISLMPQVSPSPEGEGKPRQLPRDKRPRPPQRKQRSRSLSLLTKTFIPR